MLVTIATPFLEIITSSYTLFGWMFWFFIRLCIFLMTLLGFIFAITSDEKHTWWYRWYILLIGWGVLWLLINLYKQPKWSLLPTAAFHADARTSRIVEQTKGGLALIDDTSILVLRGIDDEASLALSAGSIGNRLSLLFVKMLKPFVILTMIMIFFGFLLYLLG